MDKTVNQRAWFLVLPVVAVVAFSAILPLMTVVNYSVQDTFGNNQFFWNGVGWFKELLDPSSDLGSRFFASLWRNLFFSFVILLIQVPLGIVIALSMPREGWQVAACLVILALPLLIPWNVVGTIWQIFGRGDIGLLGYVLNHIGLNYNYVSNDIDAWVTVIVMDVWHWTSLVALLCYAGLKSIPDAYYQAAQIERIDDLGRMRFARVRVGDVKFAARLRESFSSADGKCGLIFDAAHVHVYADSRLVEGTA